MKSLIPRDGVSGIVVVVLVSQTVRERLKIIHLRKILVQIQILPSKHDLHNSDSVKNSDTQGHRVWHKRWPWRNPHSGNHIDPGVYLPSQSFFVNTYMWLLSYLPYDFWPQKYRVQSVICDVVLSGYWVRFSRCLFRFSVKDLVSVVGSYSLSLLFRTLHLSHIYYDSN